MYSAVRPEARGAWLTCRGYLSRARQTRRFWKQVAGIVALLDSLKNAREADVTVPKIDSRRSVEGDECGKAGGYFPDA